MKSDQESQTLIAFEKKFASIALTVGVSIILGKLIVGNSFLLDALSPVIGGRKNVYILAQHLSWVLVSLLVGVLFTGLSYYIVYLDSSVPGVQPPTPFSPGRQSNRTTSRQGIHTGYFFAFVNGFLLFLFMLYWW